MAKKQWVNLPEEEGTDFKPSTFVGDGVSSIEEMGRTVYIETEFDNKDLTAVASIKVTPDGNNAKYEYPEEKPLDYELGAQAKISEDGKVKWGVKLSVGGTNKYKFSAEHNGTEKELPDEYETHRRLYYQVINMEDVEWVNDFGFLEQEFQKNDRGVSLIKIGSMGAMENYEVINPVDRQWLHDQIAEKYNKAKDPWCIGIVLAELLAYGPGSDNSVEPNVSKEDGTIEAFVFGSLWMAKSEPSGSLGWRRKLEFVYQKDGTINRFIIPPDDVQPQGNKLIIKTRNFPDGVTGSIEIEVNTVKKYIAGFQRHNLVVIGSPIRIYDVTGSPANGKSTIIHELAHALGMVPDGTKGLKEQASHQKHQPAHCGDTKCIMWHAESRKAMEFCGLCDKSLRKLDLYAPELFSPFYK